MHSNRPSGAIPASCLALLALAVGVADAQPPVLSNEMFLAGDRSIVLAPEFQEYSRIAPGGPGYLAVWEEARPVITGQTSSAYEPLTGNQIDIYGARLDANGTLLDTSPILISQHGRNQTKPQVAWNEEAQAWLVVWTGERPDWYFASDIQAARVSADGQVLDATPILLRPETNDPSNDYAEQPTVASDGQRWLVLWVDILWNAGYGKPNLAGKRVNGDGTVVDPSPVVIYQHPDEVFGPIQPHLAWAGDEYLVVWERAGFYDIIGKRINADLQTLGPNSFVITSSGYGPRVATNGADFLVSSRHNRAHRVTHAGVSLDPTGIDLTTPPTNDYRGPDVAWDGTSYLVVGSGYAGATYSTHFARVTPAGLVASTGAVEPTGDDQFNATVASRGGGVALVAWGERDKTDLFPENIRSARLDAVGPAGPVVDVSVGLHRQTYVRFAHNGDERLAVFVSEGGGTERILAQRITLDGTPIDMEPTVVTTVGEYGRIPPDVAWNNGYYLVTWSEGPSIYGRRLDASAQPVDPAPVLLLTDTASAPSVGALGTGFYLAYIHTFSGDQNFPRGVRIDANTMSVVGAPVQIGPGFVIPAIEVRTFGGRAFVVWEAQANHDVATSTIRGVFVEVNGSVGTSFPISTSLNDDDPGVAIAGDRALVTWSNRGDYDPSAVSARLLSSAGELLGAPFLVCEAPNEQVFTACGWDGSQFVAVWVDYRDLAAIEQLRGDIWAARITLDGVVLDPGGFQLTDGPLPEDLPEVTGGDGKAIVAYSRLDGPAGPEVQRIGLRVVGLDRSTHVADLPARGAWRAGPNPFRHQFELSFAGEGLLSGAEARVEIFGLDGRRVAGGVLDQSSRRFVWDGKSESGRPVANGIYHLRVMQGDQRLFESRVTRIE